MINIDYVNINQDELPLQPSGFLNIKANLTRTGVFVYMDKDPNGKVKVVRQLRHPDEVFSENSMASMMGLPVTNLHPSELVNTDNAKELLIGMTSDKPEKVNIENDPESYVQQQVTFHDNESINQIKDGSRRELSLGYTCELDETPGTWNGIAYDAIQRNIAYNHLSLVDRARGGAQCKVLLDNQDIPIQCDGFFITENKGEVMKSFIADGKALKVDEDVFDVLEKMEGSINELKTNLDQKQKDNDTMQAELDSLKSKVDLNKDEEEAAEQKRAFDEAVAVRVDLETKAKNVLDDADVSSLSDREIKEKVIKHTNTNLDVNLDSKSDDYISASFDISLKNYKKPMEEKTLGDSIATKQEASDANGYAEARKKAWERDQNLWKSK